jgi:hypothetical protein
MGEAYQDNELIFPNLLGEPLDPSAPTRNFRGLIQKSRLTGVRLHDLRHFHATMLLKAGTHPKVVQERLGTRHHLHNAGHLQPRHPKPSGGGGDSLRNGHGRRQKTGNLKECRQSCLKSASEKDEWGQFAKEIW